MIEKKKQSQDNEIKEGIVDKTIRERAIRDASCNSKNVKSNKDKKVDNVKRDIDRDGVRIDPFPTLQPPNQEPKPKRHYNRQATYMVPKQLTYQHRRLELLKEETIQRAIVDSNGQITSMAKILNVGYDGLRKYLTKNKHIQDLLNQYKEAQISYVEDKLMKQIDNNNLTAMIFYLKCHGKHKGWRERDEQAVTDKRSITFNYKLVVGDKKQRQITNEKLMNNGMRMLERGLDVVEGDMGSEIIESSDSL